MPKTTFSLQSGIKLYGESMEISQHRNVLFSFLTSSVEAMWFMGSGQPGERKNVDGVQCPCHGVSISLCPHTHNFFDKFALEPPNFLSTLISYSMSSERKCFQGQLYFWYFFSKQNKLLAPVSVYITGTVKMLKILKMIILPGLFTVLAIIKSFLGHIIYIGLKTFTHYYRIICAL